MATIHKWGKYAVDSVFSPTGTYARTTSSTAYNYSVYYSDKYTVSGDYITLTNPKQIDFQLNDSATIPAGNYMQYDMLLPGQTSGSYSRQKYSDTYYIASKATAELYKSGSIYYMDILPTSALVKSSVRGEHIEDVESENASAYPQDGVQAGYWYVYVGSYNNFEPTVFATIDGVQSKLFAIPAMVDGVQRELRSLFATVDGVAREIFAGGLPAVGTALNDMTWAQIRAISDAGLAADYFDVGDTKAVPIKGTVGTLAVDTTLYVYIIGIDHNGEGGITFGTFKTADGVDVALCDSYVGTYKSDGTKMFNIDHDAGESAIYGWDSSDIRYDILGSTDVLGGNASTTTATNPVPNTLMAALPADLRAVMKPMTVYSDNTGGGNTASHVTATVDYLPFLGEFEIGGSRVFANSAEQNYQKQYDYFKAGNSRVKRKHSSPAAVVAWWERSQDYRFNHVFCAVYASGEMNASYGRDSQGLAPIFRV